MRLPLEATRLAKAMKSRLFGFGLRVYGLCGIIRVQVLQGLGFRVFLGIIRVQVLQGLGFRVYMGIIRVQVLQGLGFRVYVGLGFKVYKL